MKYQPVLSLEWRWKFIFSTYSQRPKIHQSSNHIKHLAELIRSDLLRFFLMLWQELWILSKHTISMFRDSCQELRLYSWFGAWFKGNPCKSKKLHFPSLSRKQSHSFSEHPNQIKIFCRWFLYGFVCLKKQKLR